MGQLVHRVSYAKILRARPNNRTFGEKMSQSYSRADECGLSNGSVPGNGYYARVNFKHEQGDGARQKQSGGWKMSTSYSF